MKLIAATLLLSTQVIARGSDYAYLKVKNYPARCLTAEIENSTETGINKDDCLRRQQKCNMKSGTIAAKQKACKELDELYPEIVKEHTVNPKSAEKASLHNEKIASRNLVKAEKSKIREEKQATRDANKENRAKFMKRCADWRPSLGGDKTKFDTCNELIRLTQDIKKFCILTAQTIDPTFEYDKMKRKRRSVTEMEHEEDDDDSEDDDLDMDDGVVDESDQVVEEVEDDDEDEDQEEEEEEEIQVEDVEEIQVPADDNTNKNATIPSKTQRKIPKVHAFPGHNKSVKVKKEKTGKKTHEPKVPLQRKNAKQHLQSCESKRFLEWFELHKDDDDVWFGEIDTILREAQDAKDEELSRR